MDVRKISDVCLRMVVSQIRRHKEAGLIIGFFLYPAEMEQEHREALKITALWRERGRPSGA